MAPSWSVCVQLCLWAFVCLARAAPAAEARALISPYAPVSATCPTSPLVRSANGISTAEQQYYQSRSVRASANLKKWLAKVGFPTNSSTKFPTVALTTSGGGYRSLLVGAGVIQSFDSRDSNAAVAGLLESFTYQAGLSGGAWLLSSIAGNNYPTITSLKNGLWADAFQRSLLVPVNLQSPESANAYADVVADITAKEVAGFPPTLTDPWGRLLSYQLLDGTDGGVMDTMSGITTGSNFSAFNVPFPIITARGVDAMSGQCTAPGDGTQYEFSPYEFGSWDKGVRAFSQIAYLGTSMSNGSATTSTCIRNYDNLGYVLGTSSNLFQEACAVIPPVNSTIDLAPNLEVILNRVRSSTFRDLFAVYPNPFFALSRSPRVSTQKELYLVDGGLGDPNPQNNPIWPFLNRPNVTVLVVNDNSADTTDNFPNGTALRSTYLEAQRVIKSSLNPVPTTYERMPYIPPVDEIVARGFNKRPVFFGCNSPRELTIVYIPNVNYTFPSNQPTLKLQYTVAETNAMVANGFQVGNKNGDPKWAKCLACGIMKKTGAAAGVSGCQACFDQYCYN